MGRSGRRGAIGGAGLDPALSFGRERRLHARAYDYWHGLRRGRRMPAVADLVADELAAFVPHCVLIDLSSPRDAAAIAFLGADLRAQAGVARADPTLAEVPAGTLLSALIERAPELVASRAPLRFEAAFPDPAGASLLHRGILLPFADRRGRLALALGLVTWKQLAALEQEPDIAAAVQSIFAIHPAAPAPSPWQDLATDESPRAELDPVPLDARLAAARTWAALAEANPRSLVRLHAALGAAHDFLIAALDDRAAFARLPGGERNACDPAAAVALAFGTELPEAERQARIAVLARADRLRLAPGQLPGLLERYEGDYRAFAAPEQPSRSPAEPPFALRPLDAEFLAWIGHQPEPVAVEAPWPRAAVA